MSQQDVEIARRAFDAYNRLDVEAMLACVTPDLEWFPSMPSTLETAIYQGREGVERYFQETRGTWNPLLVHAQDFRSVGDRLLVLGHLDGTGRASGIRTTTPIGMVIEFQEGRIRRVRAYLDHSEAVRVSGLEE
jgi:ketosteroid isomerase-like protein